MQVKFIRITKILLSARWYARLRRLGRDIRHRCGDGQSIRPPPGFVSLGEHVWHELSHVYVLTATNHRVPRWFTEGMAVHEETADVARLGDRLDPTVIGAINAKKLLPIAQLDRGFIRPTYPNQVIVSYFQAGGFATSSTRSGDTRRCSI